jgi:hypothetical protein
MATNLLSLHSAHEKTRPPTGNRVRISSLPWFHEATTVQAGGSMMEPPATRFQIGTAYPIFSAIDFASSRFFSA